MTTITVIGLEFGAVLAGAVVVEIVFGWPGLGRLFYDAIYRRDFPLLTGGFMFSVDGRDRGQHVLRDRLRHARSADADA